jgi:peptidylprolyl isomerase
MGPDGKPVMGDPVPIAIPQGMGRVIPGFDYGLEGMKIGGKRRIFIPWQMAYGTRAMADRPDHPGIPAKSDLIFDVELVDVTDAPQPPQMSRPGGMPGGRPMPPLGPHPGASAPPAAAPSAPATQPASPAAPAASAPTQPAAPAQTTPPTPPSGVQAQPQPK